MERLMNLRLKLLQLIIIVKFLKLSQRLQN